MKELLRLANSLKPQVSELSVMRERGVTILKAAMKFGKYPKNDILMEERLGICPCLYLIGLTHNRMYAGQKDKTDAGKSMTARIDDHFNKDINPLDGEFIIAVYMPRNIRDENPDKYHYFQLLIEGLYQQSLSTDYGFNVINKPISSDTLKGYRALCGSLCDDYIETIAHLIDAQLPTLQKKTSAEVPSEVPSEVPVDTIEDSQKELFEKEVVSIPNKILIPDSETKVSLESWASFIKHSPTKYRKATIEAALPFIIRYVDGGKITVGEMREAGCYEPFREWTLTIGRTYHKVEGGGCGTSVFHNSYISRNPAKSLVKSPVNTVNMVDIKPTVAPKRRNYKIRSSKRNPSRRFDKAKVLDLLRNYGKMDKSELYRRDTDRRTHMSGAYGRHLENMAKEGLISIDKTTKKHMCEFITYSNPQPALATVNSVVISPNRIFDTDIK